MRVDDSAYHSCRQKIDAEMAARLLLAGKAKAVPKQTDGIVESIRLLRVARHGAVKSRSAAMVHAASVRMRLVDLDDADVVLAEIAHERRRV